MQLDTHSKKDLQNGLAVNPTEKNQDQAIPISFYILLLICVVVAICGYALFSNAQTRESASIPYGDFGTMESDETELLYQEVPSPTGPVQLMKINGRWHAIQFDPLTGETTERVLSYPELAVKWISGNL